MLKIYMLIVVVGLVSGVVYGGYYYYKDTQSRIQTLTENNAKVMAAKAAQDQTINTLIADREKFDKLNMFTSNWENQVTEKLDEVNLNLVELMKELRDVGDRIVGSIDNLSYITEESTRQLTSKMEEIDSTLKAGNLINVIQTYQMYKVNKSTKSLKG